MHNRQRHLITSLLAGAAYLLVLGLLAYGVARYQTGLLLGGFGMGFGLYLLLLQTAQKVPLLPLLILAGFARLLLLPAVPALSDDFYRFLWDGHLLIAGLHPFTFVPEWYMQPGAPEVAGLTRELYEGLNSKQYFTIYPPLAQGLFAMAALLGGDDLLLGIMLLRLPLLLAELGTIWLLLLLLKRYGLPRRRVLLYALNPLVVLELTGNLHLEALAIFFLLLLIWAVSGLSRYRKEGAAYPETAGIWRGHPWRGHLWRGRWKLSYQRMLWAAVAFAGAVASKLWPLLLGPYLLLKIGWKKGLAWILCSAVLLAVFYLPFFGKPFIEGMQNSLSLYYQRFEFNAGLYYLLRAVGQWWLGYNPIIQLGPLLAVLASGAILYFSWCSARQGWRTPKTFLLLYGLFLLFATTVHPWYVLPLVAIMPLSRFRFPLLWSGLAFLTYAGYTATGYQEPVALVALEYMMVIAFLLWEIKPLIYRDEHGAEDNGTLAAAPLEKDQALTANHEKQTSK